MASSLNAKQVRDSFVTVCANCSSVKITETQWIPVTKKEGSLFAFNMQLSHGICPQCMKVLYGDLFSEDLTI